MTTVTGLTAERMLAIEAAAARNIRGAEGHIGRFDGDSRCNPSLDHTPRQADRWTSRVAHNLGQMQQRNYGIGGSSVLGEGGDQPLPRALAHIMGVYGPGYAYTSATTQRQFRASLACLIDAYNTLWKWPIGSNPRMYDTFEKCVETWARLQRAAWAFPVGTAIKAPHWTFGAGWAEGALNANYGVGPTSRVEATGDGTFSFNMGASGAGTWRGGKLSPIVRARKDIDDSPNWSCRISASRPGQNYGVVFDNTGNTPGLPGLGVDGGAAFTSFTLDTPVGSNETITFTVDQIVGQCTIMGAILETEEDDVPSPVVLLLNQPHLIVSPNGSHPEITNETIDIINERLEIVAAKFEDERVAVVDLTEVINGQSLNGSRWFKDDVHYSNLGHAVIAKQVLIKVAAIGLEDTHAKADLTSLGAPNWCAVEGEAVWDRTGNKLWICKDDPLLSAPDSDFTKQWRIASGAVLPSSAFVSPLAAKLGVMLISVTKANLITALVPIGVRLEIERDGFLRDIAFDVGTASGNMSVEVYDTGDAAGGGTRTKLWASGSVSMTGMPSSYNLIDPGATAIPVKRGQHIDVLLTADNTTATFLRATTAGNAMRVPDASLVVPGGALAKLAFKYPAVADLVAATAPTTVTEANVLAQDTVPYISARVA